MSEFLDKLARKTARTFNTTRWVFKSLAGTEEESIEAEYVLGGVLASEIVHQIPVIEGGQPVDLINEIGGNLYNRLTDKRRKFNFSVLKSAEVNAFTLPGGFVFVTHRLIEFCQSDADEIAFVLGHEMGHVVRGHALDRMIANSALKFIANLWPVRSPAGQLSKQVLAKMLSGSYSQDQELEADTFGVGIMDAAHYNPQSAARFMQRIKTIPKENTGSIFGKYFASHPEGEIRIRNLNKQIARLNNI